MTLHLAPVTLRDARRVVATIHRHHGAPPGGLFAVAVADELDRLRGVAIIGRPTAPGLQDGTTVEVVRVATDGARNACSMLYGASWRAARALGWTRAVTYTGTGEDGTSVAAAGWVPSPVDVERSGDRTNRPRRAPGRVAATRWTVECSTRPPRPTFPTVIDDQGVLAGLSTST